MSAQPETRRPHDDDACPCAACKTWLAAWEAERDAFVLNDRRFPEFKTVPQCLVCGLAIYEQAADGTIQHLGCACTHPHVVAVFMGPPAGNYAHPSVGYRLLPTTPASNS